MALPVRRPQHALVGSAVVGTAVAVGDRSEAAYRDRQDQDWQIRALRIIDLIPELDYASRFHAKLLSQLRIFPAKRLANGKLEEIEDGPAVEALKRIADGSGGFGQILASYGQLRLITGEGNLFGYDLNTEDETWTYVWNEELSVERKKDGSINKIKWTPSSTANPQEFSGEQAVVYKFWKSHPRRTGEPTSPMRAIVEGMVAEELIALTRSVRSTAVSRATRGILIIPQEIQPPPVDTEGDEDPMVSPWLSLISEHLEAQVDQAGSAAAASPYLMEVAYEYADRIRVLQLHDPQHDYAEQALRKEAIERIAMGIDFPKEALTGIGETNHWAAMQILMDQWRSHGQPAAQDFCNDLTTVYLRPALREAGEADWRDTVVTYDASMVTVKPDRSEDAKTALTLYAIGPSGYRKMLDIDDEFAPSPEELEQMKELRSRGQQRALPPAERDPSADGPEAPGPEGDSGRRSRMSVMDLALMRCRELAGIRIKQKMKRHFPERIELIENIPFCDIAAVLGRDTLKEMGLANAIWLVDGGADNLRSLLNAWGYAQAQAELFAEAVEAQAASTLYDIDFPTVDASFSALANQLEMAA